MVKHAIRYKQDLHTCATQIKIFIDHGFEGLSREIIVASIVESFRKAHSRAVSDQGKGKFFGHKCWSKQAVQFLEANNWVIDRSVSDQLRHEHVVPLTFLVNNILLEMPKKATVQDVVNQIDIFGHVAIISRDEDKALSQRLMPDSWNSTVTTREHIFVRYMDSGLYHNLVELKIPT